MSTTELRNRAKEVIEKLPPERLKVAASFLAFLDTPAGKTAQGGLAGAARARRRIEAAERDIAAGRGVDWRKVRSDV